MNFIYLSFLLQLQLQHYYNSLANAHLPPSLLSHSIHRLRVLEILNLREEELVKVLE